MRWYDRKRIWFNAKFLGRLNMYEVLHIVGSTTGYMGLYATRRDARAACQRGLESAENLRATYENAPEVIRKHFQTPSKFVIDKVTYTTRKPKPRRVKEGVDVYTEPRS
jgi:hypothetical protein